MCVLTAKEIEDRIKNEGLIRDYIDLERQLQPNGFDCTLKYVAKIKNAGRVDFDNTERVIPDIEVVPFKNDWVFLQRGVYRVVLNEIIKMSNDICAIAYPRSSLIRCGADVLTAVWDAGYEGRSEVAIVVHNEKGIWLKRNARIVQLVFLKLTSKTWSYKGIFMGENI